MTTVEESVKVAKTGRQLMPQGVIQCTCISMMFRLGEGRKIRLGDALSGDQARYGWCALPTWYLDAFASWHEPLRYSIKENKK